MLSESAAAGMAMGATLDDIDPAWCLSTITLICLIAPGGKSEKDTTNGRLQCCITHGVPTVRCHGGCLHKSMLATSMGPLMFGAASGIIPGSTVSPGRPCLVLTASVHFYHILASRQAPATALQGCKQR